MTISPHHLESLARAFRERAGVSSPIDAFVLVGFDTKTWSKAHEQLDLEHDAILYPSKARLERIHFKTLRELLHRWLRENGESDRDEHDVDQLASRLLPPREDFLHDLGESEWDLFEMKRRSPNASHQAIVVRMCELSSAASASVWDAGKAHASYGHADPADDAGLVDGVLETEAPVCDAGGEVCAWPVFEGGWRRFVVVRRAA